MKMDFLSRLNKKKFQKQQYMALKMDDDFEIKQKPVKDTSFSRKLKLACLLLCLASTILLAVILYLTLNNTSTDNEKIPIDNDCATGHEQYQLSSPSKLGKYKHAAVAADSAYCSTVGKNILLQNGSAVDAAIATGLCNGLFNPQSLGIGGGHFMLVYLKEKNVAFGIDSREVAPLKATSDMFVNKTGLSEKGGLATAVPGEIAGYWMAHKIAGHLPWKKLFEPSINYTKNGIIVSTALASAIKQYENDIRQNPVFAEIFINQLTNQTVKANDTIKMLKLANTLEIIAEKGAQAFYDGELSEKIVEEVQNNGGIFTLDDLKSVNAFNRTPIEVRLNDKYRVLTMPPPSSGVLVTFALNVLSRYNLSSDSINGFEKSGYFYHRLLESYKHAFAKRSFLGDMNYVDVEGIVKNLTSPWYIDIIKTMINDSITFNQSYYGPAWPVQLDYGTSHTSIIAENGDAVSLTSTINTFFGAKYAGETTGIIYNNEMDDFSTPGTVNHYNVPASEANFIKPGKKPMSSMSPLIVLDENNDVRLVLGASGGTKIITAVALVALRNIWLEKNIKDAIDEPRVHHQLFPIYAEIEKGFPLQVQKLLLQRNHTTKCFNYGGSTVQGVERRPNNEIWANSDARKGGAPDGY